MKNGVLIVLVFAAILILGFAVFKFYGNSQQNIYEGSEAEIDSSIDLGDDVITPSLNPRTGNPISYTVNISGFRFSPQILTIKIGDSVAWTNADSASHTVTSDSGSELDSNYLSNGEIYSHTFTQIGEFDYHCAPHPYMKGTVIVE